MADDPIELEPGETLDLTDPDNPTIEEPDGDVVDVDQGNDDSDSGGSSGSSPEPDNNDSNGGSDGIARLPNGDIARTAGEVAAAKRNMTLEEFKNTKEYNDDNDVITVSGDPSEGDDIRARGEGETVEEARRDAAQNPDVDFAGDTPVGKKERQLETNQPLADISQSQPEEVQKRLEEIAGSEEYQGKKLGRTAGELAQKIEKKQKRNNLEINNQRFNQILKDKRRNRQEQKDKESEKFLGKTRNERVENAQEIIDSEDLDNTLYNTGEKILDFSRDVGRFIDKNPEIADQASETASNAPFFDIEGSLTRTTEAVNQVLNKDDKLSKQEVSNIVFGGIPGEKDTELENQQQMILTKSMTQESLEGIGGFFTVPGTIQGIAESNLEEKDNILQASEETVEDTAKAAGIGATAAAGTLSKNPKEAKKEGIQEVFSFANPVSIPGTVTVGTVKAGQKVNAKAPRTVSDKVAETRGLITGELGSKVESDKRVEVSEEAIQDNILEEQIRNMQGSKTQRAAKAVKKAKEKVAEGSDFLIKEVNQNQENIDRAAVGAKEGNVVFAERKETSVNRREFLNENINLDKVADVAAGAAALGASASGTPAATASTLVKPDTSPTSTSPTGKLDKIKNNDIFSETKTPRESQDPLSIGNLATTNKKTAKILEQPGEKSRSPTTELQEKIPKKEEKPLENILNPPETKTTPDQEQKPEITTEQILEQETKITPPTTTTTTTTNPGLTLTPPRSEEDGKNKKNKNEGLTSEFEFAPSVGAEILGITAEEKPSQENVQNPFKLRPVVEEEEKEQEEFLI